jgi:NADH dehydrogenase [ubiquinone] 1 alpha subcomplex assembly factor 6
MATIPGSVKQVHRETPVPQRRSAEAKHLSPVAALVQRHDRDRFQTVLFAPAARREALFALYAFNYQIARVRESVTQPALGQMRLEWWRENIASAFARGAVRHHPVVAALTVPIRELALTRSYFERLIDARQSDFDGEPPASLAALEDYAEGSSANLVYLALEVLDARDPASRQAGRHVGIAYAIAGLLRAMPFWAPAGRQFIPRDIAERNGITEQGSVSVRDTLGLWTAARELATAASRHLDCARAQRCSLSRATLPALLPARVAQGWLARLGQARYNPFDPSLAAPDPLQLWRLALAALLNRF